MTPLGRNPYQELRLTQPQMMDGQPPGLNDTVVAIDNTLRGWVGGLEDLRMPWGILMWVGDYTPCDLELWL